MLPLNDWNVVEVEHAEQAWGSKLAPFTADMFEFVTESDSRSFLDLGCGFGRFLNYLGQHRDEPDYIGYDSSDAMIRRLREVFPDFSYRTFQRNLIAEIRHPQEAIICSAVFIHLSRADQVTILNNVFKIKPRHFVFDINCPNETSIDRLKIKQTDHYERRIKTRRDGTSSFRMTWQDHSTMTSYLLKEFKGYELTLRFYDLHNNCHRAVYFLRRRDL